MRSSFHLGLKEIKTHLMNQTSFLHFPQVLKYCTENGVMGHHLLNFILQCQVYTSAMIQCHLQHYHNGQAVCKTVHSVDLKSTMVSPMFLKDHVKLYGIEMKEFNCSVDEIDMGEIMKTSLAILILFDKKPDGTRYYVCVRKKTLQMVVQ